MSEKWHMITGMIKENDIHPRMASNKSTVTNQRNESTNPSRECTHQRKPSGVCLCHFPRLLNFNRIFNKI
jgi:hypothetical protein